MVFHCSDKLDEFGKLAPMVLISFRLAVIYWLIDSSLCPFLLYDNFLEKILGVQLDNIWAA